ncbi:MAG TPA: PA14 domain-containing protein, partial [Thermoanaerobaculia bacterium]
LSVRHEAPQAFRTLATVPAIALLAGDVLARTARGPLWIGRRTSEEKPSRWNLRVGASAAILLLGLIAAAAWEIRVYFGRQADSIDVKSSFNLPENHAAHEVMDALEKGQEIYLSPREYEFSPLKFLVYGMMKKKAGINILPDPPYRLIRPEIDFPVPDHGKDVLLLLSTNYWPVRDYFLQFYPDAPIELAKGPGNIPLYVRMRLPRSMVAGLQGLHARLTHGDGRVEETIQPTPDSGGQALSAAEWTGGLRVEVSGSYDFPTDGNLKTTVDGEAWAGRRFLYRGFHDLRVALAAPGRPDPVRLSWTFPGGPAQPVPPQALFRVARPRVGLMGTYFRNTQWEGPPLFRQITPIILLAWNDRDSVEGGGFSARFTGSLRVTTPGSYAFHIEADDGARLTIDGRVLGEGLVPNQPNAFRTSATLTAGDHPIQIDYFQSGGGSVLEFFWQPPGEPELPVPPSALLPGE